MSERIEWRHLAVLRIRTIIGILLILVPLLLAFVFIFFPDGWQTFKQVFL